MFEVFRSRETIAAIYFDGSLEVGMEIARAFPGVAIEFTGEDSFLLNVRHQAAFIKPHTWVYRNGSSRLEWRDTEELQSKWEKWTNGPTLATPKRKKK